MRRRGFTLLEVAMAAALSSMVALAALGVMLGASRGEELHNRRLTSTFELERLQTAARRLFLSLHMAPPAPLGADESAPPPEPRFVLDTSGPGGTPRLEVVLNRAPLPGIDVLAADWAARRGVGRGFGGVPGGEPSPLPDRSPRRVAFELHPDAAAANGTKTWTLWYRPIGLEPESAWGERPALTDREAARLGAYPLATGLTRLQWTIFQGGERLTRFSAARSVDLPAYCELELETAEGAYANWLFEIGWLTGRETEAPEPDFEPDLEPELDESSEADGGSS